MDTESKPTSKNQVYQIVTDKIINMLESGNIPWDKPWVSGTPTNLISKKAYRGINPFLLNMESVDKGYTSQYWLTFNQAKKLKGTVKKGEAGTLIIFWKFIESEDKNGKIKSFPILRYYKVFNVEQCEGINYPKGEVLEFNPIDSAQKIVDNMPNLPNIESSGNCAFYHPKLDYVNMPNKTSFKSVELYYSVLFHELGHSTGHYSRLNRFGEDTYTVKFGSEDYSKEELIAELTSAMLCGTIGIDKQTLNNSAGYIQSWLKVLKGDSNFVISASSLAQKACDYMLNIS